ncbi:phage tail protein [Bacillus cereus]|uniref:phage tail protein n=1 Tax=Bacillus cereus TaxID=1396 RepID=UPI001B8AEE87|nr:phage tail protein [Bacillus cereus]QUW30184.1 phage tail protein [Bacillus cereus]
MKRVERPKIEQLSTGDQFHLVDMNVFEVIEGKNEPSSIRFEVPDTENNKRVFGYVEDRNLLVFEGQYYILLVNKLNELGFKDCDAIQVGAELSRQTQEQKITGYLSIEEGLAHIFKGSNFKYVNQCSPKNQVHFENFGGANRMSMIQNLIKRYDIECIFDNMTVIFADRIGKTTDKLYKFGYNVNAIEKTTDDSNCSFSVLLLGHTPTEEEGGGEQFQYYYESPLKYQMPELIRHRQAENIEDDKIKDKETALKRCKEAVEDIPIVSITVDHKEASFDDTNEPKVGDKAILQHHKYNMDFDVRVVKRRRYPFEQTPNVYEFSNKRDELVDRTEEQKKWTSDILSVVKELDKKLLEQSNDYSDRLNKITEEKVEEVRRESEAAKELAELVKENQKNFQTTIIESNVPPTDHLEAGKSLWLDTSKGKPGILKKWNGKTWDPIIADVEAIKNETLQQVNKDIEATKQDLNGKVAIVKNETETISSQILNIQKDINGKVDSDFVKEQIKGKADKSGVFTKDEINNGFVGKQIYETDKQGNVKKFQEINTSVEQTNESIRHLATKESVTDLGNNLTQVSKVANGAKQTADGNTRSISQVDSKVNQTATDFNKKTTAIEETVNGVSTKVTNIQTEQGKISERVTKSEQTADGFKQSIESLTKKDTDISNKLNTVESTVEGTKKTISEVQQTTSELKKTTMEVKEQAGKISEKLTSVETKVNNDKAGGRNLLLDSNVKYEKTDYLINQFTLSENFSVGEEYTFVIKGSAPQGQKFGIWQNGGSNNVGYATNVYANGVTYVTFKAVAATSGNERKLSLYNFPSNTTKAVVEWVALYKGNKPQDWTPAPENQVTNAEFTKKATEIEKSVEGVKTTVTGVQNSQSGFEKRMTTVEQTANGLSNSVSQLAQTTTNQGKQITDANSKLDQQAKLIEAKVNIKQVEDYVGGFQIPALKNTVDKNREEALKQIADKVAKADYNKKTTEIDNRLKINEEGIGLSAKKTEVYTRLEADGKYATTAYVKTMEARIDVAERNINLSVKEGNVIAAINISKETIQLDAKRINLRGAVTTESIAGKLLEGITIRAVDPNDKNKKAEMTSGGKIFSEWKTTPDPANWNTARFETGLQGGALYTKTFDAQGNEKYKGEVTALGVSFSIGNDNANYGASVLSINDNGQGKSVTAKAYLETEGWRPVFACNHPRENEYGVFRSNGIKFVRYGNYQNEWVNENNRSFLSLYKARLSSDDAWWGYLQIKSGDDSSHSGVVATEYKTTSQRKMKTFIKDLQFDALQDVLGLKIKEYYFKSDINTLYEMREQRVEGQMPYTLNDIPKYYGFMVDDCPISFTDTDRKGVNLYASLSVTIKGFQQYVAKTDERLNKIEKVINNENSSTSRNLRKSGGRTAKRSQSRKKHLFIAHNRTRSGKSTA